MATQVRERAPRRPLKVEVTPRTFLWLALVATGAWLLVQLWNVVLVLVLALLLVGTLHRPVAALERRGLRRPLAVTCVFLGILVAGALALLLVVPTLLQQVVALAQEAPRYQATVTQWLESHRLLAPVASSVRESKPGPVLSAVAGAALVASERAALLVGYALTTLFLAFYLLLDEERARNLLFTLLPRRYHVRTARILLNLETIVGGYVRGQVITSLCITVFTFCLLALFRAPNALAVAVFAGLTDALPFVGGLLATTPAVLVTLTRGLVPALVVLGAMVLYQEFENRVLVPRVYGRTLRLPAAAVLLALLIGGTLMGVLGALLALPVAAGLRMALRELRVELPGDRVEPPERRRRDARVERTFERLTEGAPASEAAAIATELAKEVHEEDESKGVPPQEAPLTTGHDAPHEERGPTAEEPRGPTVHP